MDRSVPESILMVMMTMLTSCSGIVLTTSSPHAMKDQGFQFTCTVGETLSSNLLLFRRGNKTKCTILLSPPCGQLVGQAPYSCFCGQSDVYHMNISSVSQQDEGTWVCEHGRQGSNTVSLPVYYGPYNVTVDKASPVTVTENVTVSLTARCSADCKPACSYIWIKRTQQVSDNRDLPVGRFRRGQGGDYRCTARNPATGVSSASQTLTVTVQWNPAMPTHNCPSWIALGQTGSCTCQTSDRGNPAGTVQWISPGGQTLAFSRSSSVALHMASITISDNMGTFICRAANSVSISGRDSIYSVNIAYLERPQLHFDKKEAHENASVTVSCTVDSNPIAKMTVANSGSETQPTLGVTNNLTFTTKTHCLRNMFRCTAENTQTKTPLSTIKQLTVVCSPRHDSSKQTESMVTGKLKTTASLTADTIANPLPNFTWYHYQWMTPVPVVIGTDNVVLTKGLQSALKVRLRRTEDYGIYRVDVQNRAGITSLFFSLTKDVSAQDAQSCNILPVAAGEGAVIVMLIMMIIVFLLRRSSFTCTGALDKRLPRRDVDDTNGEPITRLQRDASCKRGRDPDDPLPDETDMYSNLDSGGQETETDTRTYTELREFETISDSSTLGNKAHESLQVRTPQMYEDIIGQKTEVEP